MYGLKHSSGHLSWLEQHKETIGVGDRALEVGDGDK